MPALGEAEFKVHLQPGKGRAQLVRGIGEKALLDRVGLAHPFQHFVERFDRRRDLHGRAGFRQRPQIVWPPAKELGADSRQWRDAMLDTRPRQHDRCKGYEQRRHQFGCEDFPDQTATLGKGFSDLDVEAGIGAHCCDSHRLVVMDAIEEPSLAIPHRRCRRELRGAGDDPAVGSANLEDHRIDMVEHQRLLRLHQHVEMRSIGADPDVLRHVECRIEQGAIVRRGGDAERDAVRQNACAQDQEYQRRDQEKQQAATDAVRRRALRQASTCSHR